jgi:hypothetical protein
MVMADQQPETKQARTKAVSRKLKVFQASVGFYDTVVAAPSQAAALRAWGTHQNLFKDGIARPAEDRNAVAAALAQPEVVLRRALGTNDPFNLDPGTPKIPDLPGRKRTPKTDADRTALDRAELDAEQSRRAPARQARLGRKVDCAKVIAEAEPARAYRIGNRPIEQ